jgi:4-amino-4-deoxy-L-arabinose transferase-like glycosyltransferase
VSRGRLVVLLAVSTALFSFDFGARVFATNDEARFPMLARDILSAGQWVLPRLDGIPHLNKPPLQAWLIALASWPTGTVTQSTAALPSLLAALAVVLVTYWIALRLFQPRAALIAGLTVLTTEGVFTFARVPMPDITFCAATTAAMAAFVATEFSTHRWAPIAFYGFVGMAFWTKGPAGLLPLAVVAVYLGITYGWMGLRRLISAPGIVLLALAVSSWLALIVKASQTTQVLHEVVIADLLLWYIPTTGWSWHQIFQPPLQALTIFLPWSVLLPAAIWVAARSRERANARQVRFLMLWLGVEFLLIAVAREQRMRYYLPLCPPAALLVATWVERLRFRHRALALACAWLLVVGGGLTFGSYTRARHNAATDLHEASRELSQATRVYAVKAPQLVFAFYLEQPVTALRNPEEFERRLQDGHGGDLIVAERAVSPSFRERFHTVATAVIGGRRFCIVRSGRSSYIPDDGPVSAIPCGGAR